MNAQLLEVKKYSAIINLVSLILNKHRTQQPIDNDIKMLSKALDACSLTAKTTARTENTPLYSSTEYFNRGLSTKQIQEKIDQAERFRDDLLFIFGAIFEDKNHTPISPGDTVKVDDGNILEGFRPFHTTPTTLPNGKMVHPQGEGYNNKTRERIVVPTSTVTKQ